MSEAGDHAPSGRPAVARTKVAGLLLIGFLTGALAGAAFAMFLAPRTRPSDSIVYSPGESV